MQSLCRIFFLGVIPSKCARERLDVPIHVNCNILKFVASSAVEAETGGCFVIGKDVIIIRNTLEEMVHPHPITEGFTYNTTASVNKNTINQQQSRAMNMRCFWIRDQKILKNFLVAWKSGQKTLQTILLIIVLQNIINMYVLSIYRQIKRHCRSFLSYLRRLCKGVLIHRILIWKNSTRHYPFLNIKNSEETGPGHEPRTDGP